MAQGRAACSRMEDDSRREGALADQTREEPGFYRARDLWLECEDAAKCGVTEEDIAAFRAIMLEKQGKKQEDANGAK